MIPGNSKGGSSPVTDSQPCCNFEIFVKSSILCKVKAPHSPAETGALRTRGLTEGGHGPVPGREEEGTR